MRKRWWARLARYALPQWRGFLAVLALMGAAVLFDVLRPWPLKIIIDNVLADEASLPGSLTWIANLPGAGSTQGTLAWLTAATVALFLAAWLCRVAQNYLQAGVSRRMVYGLGADLFAHLQRLSLRFHGQRTTGDLVKRVASDTACISTLMVRVLLPLLSATLTLLSMTVVMWSLDPSLTLVALGVAPVLGFCIWIFAGPMEARSYELYNVQGEVMAHAEQTLAALPIVKAFTREEHEGDRFSSAMLRTDAAYRLLTASEIRFKTATGAVLAAGTAAVIALGANHALDGTLTIGSLIVFLSYLASLYAPLETLAYLSAGYADAAAGARRVLEVLDSDEGITDRAGARALSESARGEIRIENLTFGYERDRPILHGISLAASPGETIALVGATGAGKSTLVSLILRLFDPWEGRVTFDGIDLRDLQLASLRAQVSIVLQEPFILPLTVSGNIAYGRPGASQQEIEAAAVAAHAAGFIRELPQGYDTILGERGATLSGGQRQRIAIARALLKDAPVLILDEPTAALDAATEALILDALDRLIRGRTTFIIAHRLSTVRKATRIAVLDGGKVIEEGTHADLFARSGAYRRLHALQFGERPG